MKILYFTDPHLRDNNPENRIDNFIEKQFEKLLEVKKIYEEEKCDYLFCGGDVFNKFNSSLEFTNRVLYFLKNDFRIKIYGIVGNHDILGYNLFTLNQSSLGILGVSDVFSGFSKFLYLKVLSINTRRNIDKSIYFNGGALGEEEYDIIVSHDMIVDGFVPFEHINYKDLDGCARLVLCSHYHKPFDVSTGNTRFINPGALTRQAINDSWEPQVAIIDIYIPPVIVVGDDKTKIDVKFRKLSCVEPYIKVFKEDIKQAKIIEIPKFDLEKAQGESLIQKIERVGKEMNESVMVIDEGIKRISQINGAV